MDDRSEELRKHRLIAFALFASFILLVAMVASTVILYYFIIPEYLQEATPNDADLDWTREVTQVDSLHAQGEFGNGTVIGLIDTGIDPDHPEFSSIHFAGWLDLINGEEDPYDDGGHGTEMAGIIFSNGSITGVAPEASLFCVKAVKKDGTSEDALIAQAVNRCMDMDGDPMTDDTVDLISLSLGTMTRKVRFMGTQTESAVQNALDAGIPVVAAAGNDGEDDDGQVDSPSSVSLAISVGAVDEERKVAYFSSMGSNGENTGNPFDDRTDPNKKPETVAPGVEILTCYPGDRYVYSSGTSGATAFMAGILALVMSQKKSTTAQDVVQLKISLMGTTEKLDGQTLPHDPHAGYGLVQTADFKNDWESNG